MQKRIRVSATIFAPAIAIATAAAVWINASAQTTHSHPQAPQHTTTPSIFPTHPASKIVSLSKTTTGNSSTTVGSEFDYRIEIENRTSESATVRLIDELPDETELVGSPTFEVISPTVSTTPPTVSGDSVKWEGSLSAGAKAALTIHVKLIKCDKHNGWERGVTNAAVLRVGENGISVSTASFKPANCDTRPTPRPTFTPQPTSTAPADVAVRKYGRLHPDWWFPERGWKASWFVKYGNLGGQTATDATLLDSPSTNQTLVGIRSAPLITPTTTADGLLFNIGDLNGGRGGGILLRTGFPFSTAANTVLTNSVRISATNDSNATNNTAVVTLTVPALPPIITYPRSGATCTGTITVTGKAQIGSIVELFVDGRTVSTTTVSNTGDWSVPVNLDDGVHMLYAKSDDKDDNFEWGDMRHSNAVLLKVNSNLTWDPISLTFADSNGNRHHPRHWLGWHDEIGWHVSLQPSTTYTVGVRVCCQDSAATVTMTIPSVSGTITLSDPDGDKIFTGTFTTGTARELRRGWMELCVKCDDKTRCARGRVFPIFDKPRHTVLITPNGFDPPRLLIAPGDVVEFVNMDELPRAFGGSSNMIQSASALGDDDAVRLEVGESHTTQIESSQTYYDAQNSSQTFVATVGGSVYLPLVRK
jgi:plastocyanin